MIDELNNTVWAKIGVSAIHGVGVIAIRIIPEGTKIHCRAIRKPIELTSFEGLIPEVKELIEQRWANAYKGNSFISPNADAWLLSFMNHGGVNSNYDPDTDCVTRDIQKGEEITEDYGDVPLI